MKIINDIQKNMDNLKKEIIGIYKHSRIGVFELVLSIDYENKTIDTVFISQFGAIQRGYGIPYEQGKLQLFDKGVSMYDLLAYPSAWAEFINKFHTQQ